MQYNICVKYLSKRIHKRLPLRESRVDCPNTRADSKAAEHILRRVDSCVRLHHIPNPGIGLKSVPKKMLFIRLNPNCPLFARTLGPLLKANHCSFTYAVKKSCNTSHCYWFRFSGLHQSSSLFCGRIWFWTNHQLCSSVTLIHSEIVVG